MSEKRYWKSPGELTNAEEVLQKKQNEFAEELPVDSVLTENTEFKASRRDFLKLLGFSVSAATVAASCEIPVKKAIPYIIKPEEIVPGIANFYASTYIDGGEYASVLVKTREGRPIKIDGNDKSSISNGKTGAKAQASVLSLYDSNRLQHPLKDGEKTDWATVDKEIKAELSAIAQNEGEIIILSSTVLSPTAKKVITAFKEKYGNVEHVMRDGISHSGMLYANEMSFNKKVIPSYQFDKADVIVSFACDFLNTWISPTEFTQQYTQNRIPTPENPKMSRHYQFESMMSLTGANADLRATMKPSQQGIALLNLYNDLALLAGQSTLGGVPKLELAGNLIGRAAKDLWNSKGRALVVSGSNDVQDQVVVNAINYLLSSYGSTIDLDTPSYQRQGDDKAANNLVKRMNNGEVKALIVYNDNPAYNYPMADAFTEGMKKVRLTISLNQRLDETTSLVKYACPDSHYLESWGDAEPKKGMYSLMQPTIAPLFKTREASASLLKWLGDDTKYYDYLKDSWKQNQFTKQSKYTSFNSFWNQTLQDGVFVAKSDASMSTEGEESITSFTADLNQVTTKIKASYQGSDTLELVLYEKSGIGDGRFAHNPWLQEMPDPVTKVTWDNYISVSPKFGQEQLGIKYVTYENQVEKPVAKVTVDGKTIELPVFLQPGQADNTIAIALGYGRQKGGAKPTCTGANVFPLVKEIKGIASYSVSNVVIEKTGATYDLAITQTHQLLEEEGNVKERNVIKEADLESYKKNPKAATEYREKLQKHMVTLYDKFTPEGHHWAMAVDLNACTGCSSCIVACNAENNVPVVGKTEVKRAHEMHWMRIDRYYTGDPMDSDSVEAVHQPMMCQHCDNAPCENVCPVAATNHSEEGLNQMAYNRCIGTRYCENNCPYKVRRFNWYDYQGADSFYIWDEFQVNDNYNNSIGYADNKQDQYSRMVLNPDVTVRSRGVMEKCSFCVQNIQAGKLKAKKEGIKLQDGSIKTACQKACPANAIVFGDLMDEKSEVSKLMKNERNYYVIEELHTLPSVGYLAKIRNKGEEKSA